MLNMMRNKSKWGARLLGVLAAFIVAGSGAALAAPVTFNLWAKSGSIPAGGALPSGLTVWGYAETAVGTVTKPGGPTLTVNEGDDVTVVLTNTLAQATAILFQGQAMLPDTVGATASGGTKTYTFKASKPGTFLYEAGLLSNAQHQAAMGLYGALIVRPTAAGQAYSDPATVFNDEAVLVLSEIDPALNNSATPHTFDMRNYAPKYFLINGKPYPDTLPISSTAGKKVLLRYVNAGVQHHSMAVLGLRQIFVAKDGSVLPTLNHNVVAETLAPGQTGDAIATIPSSGKFAVYDGNLALHNNGSSTSFGGMLTFVTAGTTSTTTGPTTSAVTLTPNRTNGNGAVTLSATLTRAGTTQIIYGGEYFIDTTGPVGTGMQFSLSPFATVNVSATLPAATVAALVSGNHTIYVRAVQGTSRNPLSVWGEFNTAVLTIDKVGPNTSGLTLTPNTNGTVALSATGNDTATGGSNIGAAEYFIGTVGAPGTGVAMNVNVASPIASLDATIPTQATGGIVSVRSMDALGNWGSVATINLVVDTVGPLTSAVSASKNPNNGALPLDSTNAVVRVLATFNDSTTGNSNVVAGEGFIDPVVDPVLGTPKQGSGFPFIPSDGNWNSPSKNAYADIPLGNISTLSTGNHTISVRGKDAAGNWGALVSTTLVIDKTPPTISSATLTPSTIAFGAASTTLAVTAADVGVGLNGGQYWIDGTATPPATPTTFTGTSVAITTSALAGGPHTVYVRMQDGATNWSAVSSATLNVVRAVADTYSTTINNNTAGNNRTQSITVNSGSGVLANDLPTGGGKSATPAGPSVTRTAGTGAATMTVSMNTNGGFTYTLTVPNTVTGNANIRAAKRGTYQFTYTETLNGVTSNATVTITVN